MKPTSKEWINLIGTILIGGLILSTLGGCDSDCDYDIGTSVMSS